MNDHRTEGFRQEDKAAEFLRQQGYRILEQNYTIRGGEIDVVALDPEDVLVFAEVKYRKSTIYGDPLETVNYRKQQRVRRAAAVYMLRRGFSTDTACRFDAIAIYGSTGEILHLKNAF